MNASLGPGPGGDAPDETGPTGPTGPAGSTGSAFAVGAVIGAVVLGLVWVGSSMAGTEQPVDQEPPSAIASSLLSGAAASTTPEVLPRTTRLERCASAAKRLESALSQVNPAMTQWQVHVGAMNKLVVGEITLQQATDFWDRTRVGAQRRLAHFHQSERPVRNRGLDCPVPGRLGHATELVRDCAAHVSAHEAAWLKARRSLHTWRQHVHDMDLLKTGRLSPEDATEMWLASWQQGVQEIDAYRGAAKASRRAPAC